MQKDLKKVLVIAISLLFIVNHTLAQNKSTSLTDYHVHLQDSASMLLNLQLSALWHEHTSKTDSLVLNADTIIHRLNKAKFTSAYIISNSYLFGSPAIHITNEYEQVELENDWIAAQQALYPQRLYAFCSVNPLKDYALKEIERCAATKKYAGLKLHFANSEINLDDTMQLKQVQSVFAAAEKAHFILLVHLRNTDGDYAGKEVKIFVDSLLPLIKHTSIQIAHMAGWGGYDRATDDALGIFIRAFKTNKALRRNVYFDISAVLPLSDNNDSDSDSIFGLNNNRNAVSALKKRIKQIGTSHILFGTDFPLTDIQPYIQMLTSALGSKTVNEILRSNINHDR